MRRQDAFLCSALLLVCQLPFCFGLNRIWTFIYKIKLNEINALEYFLVPKSTSSCVFKLGNTDGDAWSSWIP